ncbi:MoxR protein [gamma proteobacterium NOR5-3]|nr:MoxR protein [gamma proteobacterium NOR5-3]
MPWLSRKKQKTVDDNRIAVSLAHLRALEFKARGFSFLPRQPVHSILTGRHGSRLRGRGLNFEELRHYRPGDDIRSMDWKVTNRTGKPHVRVYTEERERRVHLLVDQRVSMFFGSQTAMKSVVAAEVAALAAWRVLASGDRLGGIIFDDHDCYTIPPRRSRDSVVDMLSRLAKTNAALAAGQPSKGPQLNIAMDYLARRLSHDALVIYIGDGFGWDDRSDELLKQMSMHNDVIVINIFDPAEVALPRLDELIVSDGEMQIAVSGNRARLDERFRASYNEHVGHMHNVLRRYGLPLITIDCAQDPVTQLLKALGARQ